MLGPYTSILNILDKRAFIGEGRLWERLLERYVDWKREFIAAPFIGEGSLLESLRPLNEVK